MWILAFKSLKIELQSVQPQRLGIEEGMRGTDGSPQKIERQVGANEE